MKSKSINHEVRRNSPFLTPYYSKGIIRSKLILVLQFVALVSLLLVGLPAKAADYTLSDDSANLPPGFVIVSPGNYSCGVLTLGPDDTISIGGTKPATITFIGAFTTGVSNLINADGLASDLTFVTTGTLTLGAETIMNANVAGTAAVNLGIGSILGGNLTTASTTGVVTLGANSRVAGYIHTDDGAVTVGDVGSVGGEIATRAGVVTVGEDVEVQGAISTVAGAITVGALSRTVGGGITAEAGAVTLGADVKIDGDIRTIAGGITMSDGGSTCGSVITTGAGVVTLLTNVQIGGSISSIAGAIGVGRGSTIGGDVSPAGAGVVTLVGVLVGGSVTTGDGAITLTDSRVGGTVEATGAGVVTVTNSTVEDLDLVVPPSPACLSQSSATVTLSNLMQTYTGNPITPTATTSPEGLTVDFTYDGSTMEPTNAGSYEVIGTINDAHYTGSASGTLVIAKATVGVTVTLGGLNAVYTGSPISATASTTPGGLAVDLIYDGSTGPPTNAGSYAVVGTINDINYAGSASGTLVIAKATVDVTVTLGGLNAVYTGSPISATATTNPGGLTVNFTYNNSATPPTEAGSYEVIGTINDLNYAGSASDTLVISDELADGGDIQFTITPTSGNTADLSWNGFDGHIYQIETNTDLGSVWQLIGSPVAGSAGPIVLSITLGDPRRFYRVKIIPAS